MYIYIYHFGSRLPGLDQNPQLWGTGRARAQTLATPALLSVDNMDGGKASISSANTKTQLRRLQRKHTQHSYMLMKIKLLNLVRPIPTTALQAEELETFRAHLYTAEKAPEILPLPPMDGSAVLSSVCCIWCGTWMPIPRQTVTAIINGPSNTAASEATAAEEDVEGTLDADARFASVEITATGSEEDSESIGFNNINIGAIPQELSNNSFDFFENLTGSPMLCEVVCNVGGNAAQGYIRHLRAQRVAALRARWVGRPFPGPLWLSSPPVSTMGPYSTDPHTGECKMQ